MLIKNMGTVDRFNRYVIGMALIFAAASETIGAWGYFGLVPILTAIMGSCPMYTLIGTTTSAPDDDQ